MNGAFFTVHFNGIKVMQHDLLCYPGQSHQKWKQTGFSVMESYSLYYNKVQVSN